MLRTGFCVLVVLFLTTPAEAGRWKSGSAPPGFTQKGPCYYDPYDSGVNQCRYKVQSDGSCKWVLDSGYDQCKPSSQVTVPTPTYASFPATNGRLEIWAWGDDGNSDTIEGIIRVTTTRGESATGKIRMYSPPSNPLAGRLLSWQVTADIPLVVSTKLYGEFACTLSSPEVHAAQWNCIGDWMGSRFYESWETAIYSSIVAGRVCKGTAIQRAMCIGGAGMAAMVAKFITRLYFAPVPTCATDVIVDQLCHQKLCAANPWVCGG